MAKLGEQYLQAHGKNLYQKNQGNVHKTENDSKNKEKNSNEGKSRVFDNLCFNPQKPGHKDYMSANREALKYCTQMFQMGQNREQQECGVKSTITAGAVVEQEESTEECCAVNILNPLNENREQDIVINKSIGKSVDQMLIK